MASRKISTFFEPSKRVKRASEVHAEDDGSSFSFRTLSVEEVENHAPEPLASVKKVENPEAEPLASVKISVGNHAPPEAEPLEEAENHAPLEAEPLAPVKKEEPSLTKEQRLRMELNLCAARATRNLRQCQQVVQAAQGAFPNLKDLLVEATWIEALESEFGKQYMETLSAFIKQEASGSVPIYPPAPNIFNAFNSCPFDRVKVVLLGQDPYHGPGQAMGLSFSVPREISVPSSLCNIYKELHADLGCKMPSHGNLEKWSHQGVLLLNAVLTVRMHQANSHAKKGWELFTDAAIRAVSTQRKGVVFLLWGNSAKDKLKLIDTKSHHILKAAHPSGLSAHRGFFNCRHFSQTNKILEEAGSLPIDWQL